MFVVRICLTAGIRLIITSSSDVKLDKLKQLDSSIGLINYKIRLNVTAEILRLTDGRGVHHVFNNIGVASIPDNFQMLRKRGGKIAPIGSLNGFTADRPPSPLMRSTAKDAHIA